MFARPAESQWICALTAPLVVLRLGVAKAGVGDALAFATLVRMVAATRRRARKTLSMNVVAVGNAFVDHMERLVVNWLLECD